MKPVVAAFVAAFCAWGQTGTLTGPVMGMLAAGGGIRPILGIPGAATLGGVTSLDFAYTATAISPRQDFALLVAADGRVMCVRPDGRSVAIDGASAAPGRVVISPGGLAAGLVSSQTLEIVTGLPDSPAIGRTLDLSGLPSPPAAIAVRDDGTGLAAAGGTLFLLDGGTGRPVAAVGDVAALSFIGPDAFLAGAGQVAMVREVTGAATVTVLSGGEQIGQPVAIAADRGRVLVADSSTVTVFDPARSVARLACACTVTGLERLNGRALFRITSAEAKPMWLLDAGGDEPKLWFVPEAAQ